MLDDPSGVFEGQLPVEEIGEGLPKPEAGSEETPENGEIVMAGSGFERAISLINGLIGPAPRD